MKHKSLNQLVCAATVDRHFCEMLLRDPASALTAGYLDHTFMLTPEERDLVVGIRAHALEDFAEAVYHWISTEASPGRNGYGKSNGHNGNGARGAGLESLWALAGSATVAAPACA
ncbi:MAG TPA: hypothetical protein VLC95_07425 [Anaerolineae bacterium]|jgi:hypothetical protein|nr:hypothetical protein [Anaerolineae bacterium]